MYAEIIVNRRSRAVDRAFDYEIPAELEAVIRPGSRVIIPFSRSNAEEEGFVMRVKPHTEAAKGIKPIIRLASDEPAFLESMVPVIEYMHERYLSTYLELIHTMIPSGTALKTLEWIILDDKSKFDGRNMTDDAIITFVEENGGGIDIYSLQSYFSKDIKSRIKTLISKGVLKKEYRHTREVSEKLIRAIRLTAEPERVLEYCDKTRSRIQQRMLMILLNNEYISTADLVRFSMGNYSALSAIVKNGLAEFFDLLVERNAYETDGVLRAAPPLTAEQTAAVRAVTESMDKRDSSVFLLHGVTGSGKTEVFLGSIDHAVKSGKTALMLVPEISLTPQMVARFTSRFGKRIAVLHSGLSLGERYDEWRRIMKGEADIVIGARSAVFAPLENIGIIIIDEEHSETYKSEMSPRYHAKETAVFRAGLFGAVTVLASATPSMESYKKALDNEYKLLEMKKRYNENAMPQVEIVDMREELEGGNRSMFSMKLMQAVKDNLVRGEQTILFMNRRGFSTFVSCRKCGFVPQCPNCNISLTYHSYDDSLKCHYCGFKQKNYTACPACGSKYIRHFGGGTQKVEDEVHKLFPEASTIRLDADVTGKKNSHKEILNKFAEEKIDILIGTQMVAKGLDFANVTLVGVMSADTMLHIDDFRSGERTFDTLEQVSGRAGRGEKPGRAIIQTYNPDNYAVELVKTHDYKKFCDKTMAERKIMWYPPYSEMICIRFAGADNKLVTRASEVYKEKFGNINEIDQKIAMLGPIPSGISRIKNQFRRQIIIKCDCADSLNDRLIYAMDSIKNDKLLSEIQVSIDKNPISIY